MRAPARPTGPRLPDLRRTPAGTGVGPRAPSWSPKDLSQQLAYPVPAVAVDLLDRRPDCVPGCPGRFGASGAHRAGFATAAEAAPLAYGNDLGDLAAATGRGRGERGDEVRQAPGAAKARLPWWRRRPLTHLRSLL